MAKSSYESKLIRRSLRLRVLKLSAIAKKSRPLDFPASSKLLSTVPLPKNSVEAKLLSTKLNDLVKSSKLPTKEDIQKQNVEQRLKWLDDESKKLKLILQSIATKLKTAKKSI